MVEVFDLPTLCAFPEIREAMHQQRFRVFKTRQDWDVATISGFEIDQFDRFEASPTYFVIREDDGSIKASCRILPMTGPNMIRDVFPYLLEGRSVPDAPSIWETTRFAVESKGSRENQLAQTYKSAAALFAALCEFGVPIGMTESIGVVDVAIVRLMRRLGIHAKWTTKPQRIGNTVAVIACFEISRRVHKNILETNGLNGPVISNINILQQGVAA